MPKKSNKDEFVSKSKLIHGDEYDYSYVEYLSSSIKVNIICFKHGEFSVTPNNHISKKSGCPKCYGKIKMSKSDFINRSNITHNNKYDYSRVDYKSCETEVDIICPEHGLFKQIPYSHIRGMGCRKCIWKSMFLSLQDFINKSNIIHSEKYDYSRTEYVNNKRKVIICCPVHGEFLQKPNSHLSGHGCPNCSNNVSKKEIIWLNSLSVPDKFRNKKVSICGKRYQFDAFDSDNKIIYEFYGDYWHGNPKIFNPEELNKHKKIKFSILYEKTLYRENYLKSLGFTFISIWESDFDKLAF